MKRQKEGSGKFILKDKSKGFETGPKYPKNFRLFLFDEASICLLSSLNILFLVSTLTSFTRFSKFSVVQEASLKHKSEVRLQQFFVRVFMLVFFFFGYFLFLFLIRFFGCFHGFIFGLNVGYLNYFLCVVFISHFS